jgi:hypothetical protein
MKQIVPLSTDDWMQLIESGFFTPPSRDYFVQVSALDGVATTAFTRDDIVALTWRIEGSDDGPPWLAILRLADGRWVYFAYVLEITGNVYWTCVFAADRGRLWWWACTDDDRERLSAQFSADEHADELVQLDIMLQSEDPRMRELGEARMMHIRRR